MLATLTYYAQLPITEVIAVLTGLLYVILAAKGNRCCWPAAFISTMLYTIIFYDVYLWMDSLLQVFYLVMAVYGWFSWKQAKEPTQVKIIPVSEEITEAEKIRLKCSKLEITSWSKETHFYIVGTLTIISGFVGWFMAEYTEADFPYVDAATTVFAVFATFMVTKKVLENWLYWVVIDLISIYIYIEKGLPPTAALFGLYVILAIYGYYKWRGCYLNRISSLNQ